MYQSFKQNVRLKYTTIFSKRSFLLPLVRHHSYKNEQYAIQGCNTPSRKCTAYSWRIQPIFVQYSLQPIISFERGSNCAEHAKNRSNMCLYFYISQRHSTQFTAESKVVFKVHDLLQKRNLFKIQPFFQEVHFKSFSCAFMHKVYCFPANVLLFFNKAALLRQNIDDAWKRSRFNRS